MKIDLKDTINKALKISIIIFFIIFFIIIILIIFSPFALYFYAFHGELSDHHEVWGSFGDFIGGYFGGILTFITIIILLYVHNQEKSFRQAETFNNFAKEYHSKDFTNELDELIKIKNDLLEDVPNLNKLGFKFQSKYRVAEIRERRIILEDINKCLDLREKISSFSFKLKKNNPNKFKEINKARRIVSNFFQRMFVLYQQHYITEKLILAFWGKDHSELLNDIIIPFETDILKEKKTELNNKEIENRLECLKNMVKLLKKGN